MNQEKAAYMSIRTLTAVFILSALCQSSVISNTFDEERIGFTVPAAPWTLTLPKDQLVVVQQQIKPDGRSGYFYMNDEKNKLNISFFIEPVKDCKDSKACRDMVWKAGNPMWENPQNVVLSEIGDVSYFEFFMPSLQGVPFKQQNMYAEFVKDGFWVDLHISKVHYKPEEHEFLSGSSNPSNLSRKARRLRDKTSSLGRSLKRSREKSPRLGWRCLIQGVRRKLGGVKPGDKRNADGEGVD